MKTKPFLRVISDQKPPSARPKGKSGRKKQGLFAERVGLSIGGKQILRSVSVGLKRGEAVALFGPNGAGKTTLFYAISGLLRPDYGEIWLDGEEIGHLPMYRRSRLGVGYLPQESSVFRGLTVEQNIEAVLEETVTDSGERRSRLEQLMGEFSITHLRKARSISLSGGERRRLEIARCLACSPRYIILDEPLAGIDPISVMDVRKLIRQLCDDMGIGVLISDHNVREALDIVDRSYIIHDGQVLKAGTKEEIIGDREVRDAYLGRDFRI